MKNKQMKTLKNAVGKIDYTLMNDCMFHSVMTKNGNVLKGLLCALLHLKPDEVQSITILNPIELGDDIRSKSFILDIKLLLNDTKIINIELQVRPQYYWNDRSLIYLCRLFDNLQKGEPYSDVMPAYHISLLDFTPFPEHPAFYATNKMMNVQKHYIYNDKFTLNVLDLNQIERATDEDKQWIRLRRSATRCLARSQPPAMRSAVVQPPANAADGIASTRRCFVMRQHCPVATPL